MRRPLRPLLIVLFVAATTGCSSLYSYTNTPLLPAHKPPAETPPTQKLLATLDIDAHRGNPRVLMFLALSGGGSRSAYFSASTMLALERAIPGTDLLAEVDVISAVSGGALAGAHYASTRDASLWVPEAVAALAALPQGAAPAALKWSIGTGSGDVFGDGTLTCAEPLTEAARRQLSQVLFDPRVRQRIDTLCAQAHRPELDLWSRAHVPARMRRNYQGRWIGNWFWPTNIARYWTTSYDRADLMAQTLADNLFDSPILGRDLTLARLNEERPYLILNATNASRAQGEATEMPFGSVFTFTREDFAEYLKSDIGTYKVARAVMGSSAFPVVFPAMTLADFRNGACAALDCEAQRFVHVFDGGNSDNLGLKSVKRILLQQHADGRLARERYDRIVVILIDAFTVPAGLARTHADPRGWFDRFLDLNVIQATDSLLQANRRSLIDEFADGRLSWTERDCANGTREYPVSLCRVLPPASNGTPREIDLADRLIFYHFGFDDIEKFDANLKRRLDAIPTAFKLDADAATDLDQAVALRINGKNRCLQSIAALVQLDDTSAAQVGAQVRAARDTCASEDDLPAARQRGLKSR
jgi:predicted acylesterase/phospholipase RssA